MDAVIKLVEQRLHGLLTKVEPSAKSRYLFGQAGRSSDLMIVLYDNPQTAHDTAMGIPRKSLSTWREELQARGSEWSEKGLANEIATLFGIAAETIHRGGEMQGSATTQLLRRTLLERNLAPERQFGLFFTFNPAAPGGKPWLGLVAAVARDPFTPTN